MSSHLSFSPMPPHLPHTLLLSTVHSKHHLTFPPNFVSFLLPLSPLSPPFLLPLSHLSPTMHHAFSLMLQHQLINISHLPIRTHPHTHPPTQHTPHHEVASNLSHTPHHEAASPPSSHTHISTHPIRAFFTRLARTTYHLIDNASN